MLKDLKLCLAAALYILHSAEAFPAPALPLPISAWNTIGKALYFQTNEEQNAIVSVKINKNGALSAGQLSYTNGTGASEISAATNKTAAPDGLSSQGSVTVVDHSLFAVNAGDNTVSLFNIDDEDPTNLTLVGAPAKIPGDFPVSVTASKLNNLVCVVTSGERSGVSCAPYSPYVGIGKMDFLRTFNLDQSTPPVGPLDTASQVLFSDDESELLVTVKGNPAVNKTGYLAAFTVSGPGLTVKSRVSAAGLYGEVNGTVAMFGFQHIPQSNNYIIADPGYGAAIVAVDEQTEVSQLLHKQVIADQQATCWVVISPSSGSAFVSDPLVNHLVELSLDDASIISVVNTTSVNDASGYTDLAAAGEYVYALAPGAAKDNGAEIAVLSVAKGQNRSILQSYSVGSWAGSSAQGLVVF